MAILLSLTWRIKLKLHTSCLRTSGFVFLNVVGFFFYVAIEGNEPKFWWSSHVCDHPLQALQVLVFLFFG